MVKNIGFCEFCDSFRNADRNENFSYEAKQLLFDYLEQMSEDTGLEYCLDVIALCCEFNEMDSEEADETTENFLLENTVLVGRTASGSFVFGVF